MSSQCQIEGGHQVIPRLLIQLCVVIFLLASTQGGHEFAAEARSSRSSRSLKLRETSYVPSGARRSKSSLVATIPSDPLKVGRRALRERSIDVLEGSSARPLEGLQTSKVYGWYVKRSRNVQEKDNKMIEDWKNAWSNSGYEPHVLTIGNATAAPEFAEFKASLDEVLSSDIPQEAERRSCYFRYLAMASVGGGMMVDLDTLPSSIAFHEALPEKFSLFCQVNFPSPDNSVNWVSRLEHQYGLPCMAAGTKEEWLKLGHLSIQATRQFLARKDWTDMHSLQRMMDQGEVELVRTQRAQSSKTRGWDICSLRNV